MDMDMDTNAKGLELIKKYEGFRSNAYRDPVGIWTIGYGHTSAAGAPVVTANMNISKEEGEKILRRDLAKFEDAVQRAVKVPLNSNQFSALVSFCYNVGEGAFKSSSVLKAVNARNFSEVPRRLSLWNKAGGKVLPGLVKRRAAEGALFMEPINIPARIEAEEEHLESRETPDKPKGKPMMHSTTVAASGIAGAAGTVGIVADLTSGAARTAENTQTIWGFLGEWGPWILLFILLVAVGWIIWERYKKSSDDGV